MLQSVILYHLVKAGSSLRSLPLRAYCHRHHMISSRVTNFLNIEKCAMSIILSKITHKLLTKIENGICLSVRGGVCGGGANFFIEFLGVSSNSKTKNFQKKFSKFFLSPEHKDRRLLLRY